MTNARLFCRWATAALLSATPLFAHAADIDARIDWGRKSALGTAVSGVVVDLPVAVGQAVKAGQLLLQLDQRVYRARVDAAHAESAYRDLMLAEAKLENQRINELNQRKMLSEHELALGAIALAEAQHRFAAARAALSNAEYDLNYSEIRAPYDGVLLARHVELGQFVQTSTQAPILIEVGESAHLIARATLSAGQAARLNIGNPISLYIGGKRVTAHVRELIPQQNKDGWTLTAAFDPQGTYATAGMKASIRLP